MNSILKIICYKLRFLIYQNTDIQFIYYFLQSWEVQFFAATTLHMKITKQWDEVPKNEYPVLRERLLNSMKQSNIPKYVLSKLCQAVIYVSYNNLKKEHNSVFYTVCE